MVEFSTRFFFDFLYKFVDRVRICYTLCLKVCDRCKRGGSLGEGEEKGREKKAEQDGVCSAWID